MKKEDAKPIDLNDWTLSGGGAQGDSYFHKEDKNLILKLFNEGYDVNLIIDEIELTAEIIKAGVPCPPAGEFVICNGRYGITFKRILNKQSLCTAVSKDPSRLEEMAFKLADMGRDLHSRSSEGTKFISAHDYYYNILKNNEFQFTPEEFDGVGKALEIVKRDETKTLIHGDFHYGNVITDGVKDYFIDLGTFAYGNPNFDHSMFYYCTKLLPDPIIEDMFHLPKTVTAEFWRLYKERYFGPNCPSDEELEVTFAPYCVLRTLFIEKDHGHIPFIPMMLAHFIPMMK